MQHEFGERWLGRTGEANEVYRFLSTKYGQELGNGALCVYGDRATGKSALVVDLLETKQFPFVRVDRLAFDAELRSQNKPTLLYSLLVSRLISLFRKCTKEGEEEDNNESGEEEERQVCSSFPMFQSFVETLVPQSLTKLPVVFVVDDAEYLANKTAMFNQFLQIKTSSKRNLRLIFISRQSIPHTDAAVFFAPYSVQHCKQILLNRFNKSDDDQTDKFGKLLDYALAKFPNGDLLQAAYTITVLWRGSLQAGDEADWESFSHLRVLELELTRKFRDVGDTFHQTKHLLRQCSTGRNLAIELDKMHVKALDSQAALLPMYGKVLLLACFLAGNNPKEQDLVLFGDKQRRKLPNRKKRLVSTNEGEQVDEDAKQEQEAQTKTFGMTRVQYLFNGLSADLFGTPKGNVNLFPVMELLVQKRLVLKAGNNDFNERFKCPVSIEVCESVTRALGLELNKYLYQARGQ
ncbi:hypothetical protein BASA81_005513 [Batrachochytrium salamandrivorans]|nr:hypothetical protein BASA81_005513 [Batrachochytrium salamandrivorans]